MTFGCEAREQRVNGAAARARVRTLQVMRIIAIMWLVMGFGCAQVAGQIMVAPLELIINVAVDAAFHDGDAAARACASTVGATRERCLADNAPVRVTGARLRRPAKAVTEPSEDSEPPAVWWCVLAGGVGDHPDGVLITTSACMRDRDGCDDVGSEMAKGGYKISACRPRSEATCFTARGSNGVPFSNCFNAHDECSAAHHIAAARPELSAVTACELVR